MTNAFQLLATGILAEAAMWAPSAEARNGATCAQSIERKREIEPQSGPGDAPIDSSFIVGDDSRPITDIIVTAQKREERIQDVPISISVVSAEALTRSGAKNLIELQGIVPGVFFSGNAIGGSAPVTVRGVTGVNTYLLDDPVALYVNGVYQTSGQFGSLGLLDVESIEIIRGPQGTLEGRNATAGAILIKTADPTSVSSGYVRTSVAAPLEGRAEIAASGPLGSTLQVRIAANFFNERGWGRNTFSGSRIGGGRGYALRGTIRWQPAAGLDIRLIGGRNYTFMEPALARYAATNTSTSLTGALQPPGTLTPTTPLSRAERRTIENDLEFALNRDTFSRIANNSLVLDAVYDLGGVELISVTGYDRIQNKSQTDIDSFARTGREGYNEGDVPTRNFSEELRLQSNGTGRFSYILGLYYSRSDQDLDTTSYNLQLTNPLALKSRFVAAQKTSSYAGFADATLRLTDRLSVTGGVRYTRETKTFELVRTFLDADTAVPVISVPDYRPSLARFDNTSIRAKLIYNPDDRLMLYASYSTGFKSGGFNAFGVDPAFRPETLKSYEAGVKGSFSNKRIDFAAAAYTNQYDDMQVRYGIVGAGLGIANAASSKIQGFELETNARVFQDLSLSGSLSYTDARFNSFKTALDILNRPVDASNNRLPRSPVWQYSIRANYAPRLSEDLLGAIDISWQHRSKVYFYQTDQTSSTLQGRPLGELNIRAGITFAPQQITATIFATNLNNGRSVNGLNIAFSYPSVTFNKPRTVGVQLEKRF